jgi:glucose-6-phosphate isomerase
MKIDFTNINFEDEVQLDLNINDLNFKIKNVCNNLPALNIAKNSELLNLTIEKTESFKQHKTKFVVFGTGGSNLGARALINILVDQPDNILFFDNIDPLFFQSQILKLDFATTGFIVISKSGSTPETLSQLGSIVNIANEKNILNTLYNNMMVITEFKDSPLFNIAKKNNCLLLEHQDDIGGRYSVFSNVGMVPAIIAGLNVKKIHEGVVKLLNKKDFNNSFKFAQMFKYSVANNFSSSVLMTYSDGLNYFGKWYLQLWAESIGKQNRGVTALHATGTTDQHSQLQLYLDGPKDKFFTIIKSNYKNKGLLIDSQLMKDESIDYLVNKKMGDLMHAEQDATIDTFKLNGFKFREIFIESIDEENIGMLMANSIIETIAACIYFDVDPFDQPAVEQGKVLTKKYLS